MTAKSETVTIRLGARTMEYVQRLATLAGVTPNQAISVLLALSVQHDLPQVTMERLTATVEPKAVAPVVCERHPTEADPQCDQCNGWPGGAV